MEYNNKTFLIIGLILGGLMSIYIKNTDLASVIFGGLIGYLAKDPVIIGEDSSEDGSETA